MPMISYRCLDCGSEDEQFHHSNAPASIQCRGTKIVEQPKERIEHEVKNEDGTVTIEYEEIELAPTLEVCAGTALQCDSYPGQLFSRPARGFEELVIFERADSANLGVSQNKYYIPGRNWEPTEPGYKRIEITNISQYNQVIKRINEYETQKMRDHREMHRTYWNARRTAMRENVNARIRHSPLLVSLARLIRARSDRKSDVRYGKPLDAHFHAQLIEFDQGKIQDWCAEDTNWKSRRAK